MIERRRDVIPACHASQVGPPSVLLLASEPKSARAAREFVREYIEYHLPGVTSEHLGSAVLIASELVTNSIRYGTEPDDLVRVVLDVDNTRTRVEVHDPVRRHPRLRTESGARDRGRGLIIVDALCPGRWGVTDRPFGKFVWAEVAAS
ncbi:ATP-binding protein [Streptomyces graminilatus]|uniref:ATP-binding protein n=1 Tax=Streptomyces graminilatus TaxID=1464070 RepID=UPI0006E3FD07|nr:ATP-binding protein [Streptomyces graminilatus]